MVRQHTVTWHVDDLKSSHKESNFHDEKMYGSIKSAPVKANCGKIHEYLAMKLDYGKNDQA
jgi:hypothetical protein